MFNCETIYVKVNYSNYSTPDQSIYGHKSTSSSVTGITIEEVLRKLEEDAGLVLKFMASNGLVANPTKTMFMILSIWNSKLRYGLQLYAKVRTQKECPSQSLMENLQKAQNQLVRTLENVRIKDKNRTSTMLTKLKMLSVNQNMAKIKLTELWKAINTDNNPLNFRQQQPAANGRETRGVAEGKIIQSKGSTLAKDSFVYDATKIWNDAPDAIKSAKTMYSAKAEIKKFCVSLPM